MLSGLDPLAEDEPEDDDEDDLPEPDFPPLVDVLAELELDAVADDDLDEDPPPPPPPLPEVMSFLPSLRLKLVTWQSLATPGKSPTSKRHET